MRRDRPTPAGRRSGLTGRAAVLVVVVCAVVLTLAYPLREFLSQRAEISRLEAQQLAGEHRVRALEQENRRWADPEYVRSQARQRLHFVLPGETAYVLLLPPSPPSSWSSAEGGFAGSSAPWYGRLWSSLEAAGRSAGPG